MFGGRASHCGFVLQDPHLKFELPRLLVLVLHIKTSNKTLKDLKFFFWLQCYYTELKKLSILSYLSKLRRKRDSVCW